VQDKTELVRLLAERGPRAGWRPGARRRRV